MPGIWSAFNTGRVALGVNQKGMEVTGNNMANVNTPGYSRQVLTLSDVPSMELNGVYIGQGVQVDQIVREHDEFISSRLVDKNMEFGREEAKSVPLSELERIVTITEDGLSSDIDDFFDSWQELSANPNGSVEREMVVQRGQLLADRFVSIDAELGDVQENINATILSKIDVLNQKIGEIADLNGQIASIENRDLTANSFRDRRDVLLQEVSRELGVTYYEDPLGMVQVQMPNGQPLVQNSEGMTLAGVRVAGLVQIELTVGSTTTTLDAAGSEGAIGGLLDVRDNFIPELVDDLDELAYGLITSINSVHSTGVDGNGNPAQNFFMPLVSSDGAASAMEINISSGDEVATGHTAAVGDNTLTLEIIALQDQPLVNGSDTFTGAYGKLAAKVGVESAENTMAFQGVEDTLTQLENLREGQVGVSLEEEMLKLIQYQSGFEAAAKFLVTVDEMLDTIMTLKR